MDEDFVSRHDLVSIVVVCGLYSHRTSLPMPFAKQRFRQGLHVFGIGMFKSLLKCTFTDINSKHFKFFFSSSASCIHFFLSHVHHYFILFNSCCSGHSGSRKSDEIFRFIRTIESLGYSFMLTVHNLCNFIRAEVCSILVLREKDNFVTFVKRKRHCA